MSEFIVIGQRAEDGIAIDFSKPAVGELIRCKDCKYRYLSGVGKQHYVCDFLDAELKENGYCSYGERKE